MKLLRKKGIRVFAIKMNKDSGWSKYAKILDIE